MTTVQEIEAAVAQLSPGQLAIFQKWLAEFVARAEASHLTQADLIAFAKQAEHERTVWQHFAAHNLARAYGDDEPDYTPADLKTTNPD